MTRIALRSAVSTLLRGATRAGGAVRRVLFEPGRARRGRGADGADYGWRGSIPRFH